MGNTPTVLDVAREALRLAEENPDHVYLSPISIKQVMTCVYVHAGVGSCLFGQALIAAGVPASRVSTCEGHRISAVIYILMDSGDLTDGGEGQSRTQARINSMVKAQVKQDQRFTWGNCIPHLRRAASA